MDKVISSIKSLIREKNVVLFVGAGISKDSPSNLPLAGELKSYILEKLCSDEKLKEFYKGISKKGDIIGEKIRKYPFEAFLQVVDEGHDISKILEIFKRGEPNKNHILIARLIKSRYIDMVLTTNFDLLIEKALEREGMERIKDFEVFAREKDLWLLFQDSDDSLLDKILRTVFKFEMRLIGTKTLIFKLHGSADDKESIRATLDSIAAGALARKRGLLVQHFFQNGKYDNILILGYSCSDEFDLTPILKQLRSEKMILFVEHNERKENVLEIKNATKKGKGEYPFRNFNGKKVECNTRKIIRELWDEFFNEERNFDEKPNEDWKNYVDEWNEEVSKGTEFLIIGRLLKYLGELNRAEEFFKESMVRFERMADMNGYCQSLHFLSSLYLDQEKLSEAARGYERNMTYLKKSDFRYAASLTHLGLVYYYQGKLLEAIECLTKAIKIYKKLGNERGYIGYGSTLLYLGMVYEKQGKWVKALKSCSEAVGIFKKLGAVATYCSALAIIGGFYYNKARGELDPDSIARAIVYYKNSIEDFKALLDMDRYISVMIALGNLYCAQRKWEDARECFKESMQVSEELGDSASYSEALQKLERIRDPRTLDTYVTIVEALREADKKTRR